MSLEQLVEDADKAYSEGLVRPCQRTFFVGYNRINKPDYACVVGAAYLLHNGESPGSVTAVEEEGIVSTWACKQYDIKDDELWDLIRGFDIDINDGIMASDSNMALGQSVQRQWVAKKEEEELCLSTT